MLWPPASAAPRHWTPSSRRGALPERGPPTGGGREQPHACLYSARGELTRARSASAGTSPRWRYGLVSDRTAPSRTSGDALRQHEGHVDAAAVAEEVVRDADTDGVAEADVGAELAGGHLQLPAVDT